MSFMDDFQRGIDVFGQVANVVKILFTLVVIIALIPIWLPIVLFVWLLGAVDRLIRG